MPQLSNEAHEAFAQAFVLHHSFVEGAKAAGSEAENLSQAGIQLYSRAEVLARIKELSEKTLKPIRVDANRVMVEIARMSTVEYAGFYHPDGTQKLPHELTADQSACVRGTDRNGMYQFWDKTVPITLLAKHYKIVGDEGDGINALASALADRLKLARARATPIPVYDSSADESEAEPLMLDTDDEDLAA